MERTYNIYTLTCPLTGNIFYVGCTIQSLEVRVSGYYFAPTVSALKRKGLKPIIEVIDSCGKREAQTYENYWMCQLRAWGFTLENRLSSNMPAEWRFNRPVKKPPVPLPELKTKGQINSVGIELNKVMTPQLLYAVTNLSGYGNNRRITMLLSGNVSGDSWDKFVARQIIKFILNNKDEPITYKQVIEISHPEFSQYIA